MTMRHATAVSLSSAALLAFAVAASAANPPPAEAARLIERLGSPAWVVRERASGELARLGKSAEPALRAALSSTDPEVRSRARRLLELISPAPAPVETLSQEELILRELGGIRERIIIRPRIRIAPTPAPAPAEAARLLEAARRALEEAKAKQKALRK